MSDTDYRLMVSTYEALQAEVDELQRADVAHWATLEKVLARLKALEDRVGASHDD